MAPKSSFDYMVVPVSYCSTTRTLKLKGKDRYGGTTIDSDSVIIEVDGIPRDAEDAWLEFAVTVTKPDHTTFRPSGPLIYDKIRCIHYYIVEQYVLEAAFRLKKLPFQLVLRKGMSVINSRNQITLEIARSINALGTLRESYPNMMFKGDSWSWDRERVYKHGSVVSYDEKIFISKCNCNVDNIPSDSSPYWAMACSGGGGGGFHSKSINFTCFAGETEWKLYHGFNTTNFVYSIRMRGTDEYIQAFVKAEGRNHVMVCFNHPLCGSYVINIIPCEETPEYAQQVFCYYEEEAKEKWDYNLGIPLPKYVQTYCSKTDERFENEVLGSVLQNANVGYEELDVCFSEKISGHSVVISPNDTNVHYFYNKDEAEIETDGQMYLVQMYDMEANDRLYGDVFQDGQAIRIKLTSVRTFCVVLIEPSQNPIPQSGRRMDWDQSLLTRDGQKIYDEPVAVQCYDSENKLLYPALFVNDKLVKAHFHIPIDGTMLICGRPIIRTLNR